jgi:hypothetical protein
MSDDKKALQEFAGRKALNQATVKRLAERGLIEVTEVTNHQSNEKEFLPTFITKRGSRLLEG